MSSPDKQKYKSSIGFTDLLFNLVIGFVYLFMIAFILINPIAKKGDVVKKAEYLVTIEWDHWRNDDIDLWIKDPQGNIVSFLKKSSGLMNLEKDDLGYKNDIIEETKDGIKILDLNREVVTLRGTVQGEYEVMAHVYSRKISVDSNGQQSQEGTGYITVQVIKINTYEEVYTAKFPYNETGEQISLVRFGIGEAHKFLGVNNSPSSFITQQKSGGI